ncbi:MAG: MATE family efflux transporter [Lachnospiraceae bacterium]|nr:MATE family efflux transporter [Lachnospiraceae bacterium]
MGFSRKYETQYDMMTLQPVPSLILKLGLPTTISMLVTSIYNMADSYFVGAIGTSASGATGIVFGLMAILQAVGFMFGHGAGSIISRKLGAKNVDEARKFSSTSFYSALIGGFLILCFGMIFLTPLMRLLGSTDTILPYAKTYATCILIAAPAMVSSCVMNNILRYEGRAFFAMIGLTSGGLLNMCLDALFMRGLGMGIEGAGIATAISQYVSFSILLSMFLRKKTQSSFAIKYVKFNIPTIGEIVTTGLPSLARQGLGSISTMVLNNTAGIYGDAAIAAMSIVSRICMFFFSVCLGIGQGFQPVAGFNYGAGRYKRVKEGFIFTAVFATIAIGIFATFGLHNASHLVGIFRDDRRVIEIGYVALRAQCFGLFFVPFCVCNNMLFQSIGLKFNATFLSTLRNGVCFIPLIIILEHCFGIVGVQMAQALADVITFFICIPFTIRFFAKLPEDSYAE